MLKVLVFAMLSTASGWGLPSNDSLLSSNESTNIMGGVDGARDLRQLNWQLWWHNINAPHGCACDEGCDDDCDSGWIRRNSCDGGCDASCDEEFGPSKLCDKV